MNGLDAGEDGAILIQPGAGGAVCSCQVAEDQFSGGPRVRQPVIPGPRDRCRDRMYAGRRMVHERSLTAQLRCEKRWQAGSVRVV